MSNKLIYPTLLLIGISLLSSCRKHNTETSIILYSGTIYRYNHATQDTSYDFRDSAIAEIEIKPLGNLSSKPYDTIQILSSSPLANKLNNYKLPLTDCSWCDSSTLLYLLEPIGSFESYIVIYRSENPDSIQINACLGCSLGWRDELTFAAKQ